MSSQNLPRVVSKDLPAQYSPPRPALPFSRAGRLERDTTRRANEVASATYIDALRAEGTAVIGGVKVRGALAVEQEGVVGVARLADTVAAVVADGSPLAEQMVAEILAGSTTRIQRVMNSAITRIEHA